jgi:hypothetical protein
MPGTYTATPARTFRRPTANSPVAAPSPEFARREPEPSVEAAEDDFMDDFTIPEDYSLRDSPPHRSGKRRTTGVGVMNWGLPAEDTLSAQQREVNPASAAPPRSRTPLSELGLSDLPQEPTGNSFADLRSPGPRYSAPPPNSPPPRDGKGKAPATRASALSLVETGPGPVRIRALERDLGQPWTPQASSSHSRGGWLAIPQKDAMSPFLEALVERDGSGQSLYDRAMALAKVQLSKHNVEDLGLPLPDDRIQHQRFRLNSALRQELGELVPEIQRLVDGISQYVPKSMFTQTPIDPGGHLLRSCHGIRDLNLLSINFRELARRASRAASRIWHMHRYESIYQGDLSPVQTTSSWNAALEDSRGNL